KIAVFCASPHFGSSANPSLIPDTSPKEIQSPLSAIDQLKQPPAALKGRDERERHAPLTAAAGRSRKPPVPSSSERGVTQKAQTPGIRARRSLDGDQAPLSFDKSHHHESRNLLDRAAPFDAQNAGR